MQQLEYWWAINQLPLARSTFSFTDFASLVILTLKLFVASALLLANRVEDEAIGLRVYFETEGRSGLLAMSAFNLFGFLTDLFFFSVSPVAPWAILQLVLINLPLIAFLARTRRFQVLVFGIYLPLLALDIGVSVGP